MGTSYLSVSQTTKAHDISTEPIFISGLGLVATFIKTVSMSNPVEE